MLDQSFSSSNFNIIFLKENRKGNIKKKYLNQEYFEKHQEFKNILAQKLSLKNNRNGVLLTKEELDDFTEKLENINIEKEEIRNNIFFEYSKLVNSEELPFYFNINYDKQKKVYTIKKDGLHFFIMKQLQYNIHKTFKVIQADRNSIIKQTFNLLNDGFPKVVVRTDITKFYESLPQEKLFELIENNTLLSPLSRKFLKRIFYEFENVKDKSIMEPKKGIPRGLGISAYLSELYMRKLDEEIRLLPDLIYYARYVDDIITIFAPKTKNTRRPYDLELKNLIKNYGLEINDNLEGRKDKTKVMELLDSSLARQSVFEFLGYKFIIKNDHKVIVELSNNKIDKYIRRIDLSINKYNNDSKTNEKLARKMLIERLKFLTGNYRLNHNKSSIKAGIFYSNQMLTLNKDRGSFNSLYNLDRRLERSLSNIQPYEKIGIDANKLIDFLKVKFSFSDGFFEKSNHFYTFKFNTKENNIYKRKFDRSTNKYEVIKSIWKDE
ncbi:hypothetical protein M2306_001606 [Myroides gitamensis]|uniref:antiviral reverse transcriptase Drt3a n=1 Tax=Myroides odoratus TaxID=256 RepID=UPI00216A3F47|nr:antiviral reverse transcriptase Drt3a [Myroides odoratus]MCS4238285.1 hypothetical protein [Myroides odoratus]MDH6600912.1 hypothetical protein [Myroides gitamensis]